MEARFKTIYGHYHRATRSQVVTVLEAIWFQKNMSTSMAIMELVENITTAMDNGKFTIGVFIDIKTAFDTVDHSILVTKLETTTGLVVLPNNG